MTALTALSAQIAADPEYAWALHCNVAMPIKDATGMSHQQANEASAHLMQHLFGYDITNHPQYAYGKSGAQLYAEMRLAMDADEDARTAPATPPENQS